MQTSKNKKDKAAASPIFDFLAGKAGNPLPKSKRHVPGPLELEFVKGVEAEVAEQDCTNANEEFVASSAFDELLATLRLISDNKEMIDLIKNGKVESVSDLAMKMGRELSNVSRTLAKMAAYGLIGFERDNERRSKKPVWLFPMPSGSNDAQWIEAYCLVRAARFGGVANIEPKSVSAMEKSVLSLTNAAAEAFDQMRRVGHQRPRVKGATT